VNIDGRYFDGSSLEARSVVVSFYADTFSVLDPTGQELKSRPFADLSVLFTQKDGNRIDLGIKSDPDLRVILERVDIADALAGYLPDISYKGNHSGYRASLKIAVFLLVAMVGIIGTVWKVTDILPAFIPQNTVEDFGRETVEYYADFLGGRCSLPEGKAALDEMLIKLLIDKETRYPITVQVVNNEMVNAFALPGGQVVIFNGLIEKATSAEEVAGILAHEIGHTEFQHPLKGVIRASGLALVGTMLSGDITFIVQQAIAFKFSRTMEREADEFALNLLQDAQLSNRTLAGFFERQQVKNGINNESLDAFFSFASTHPGHRERLQEIIEKGDVEEPQPVLSNYEWQALKFICNEQQSQ
jgi:Zn-dependent protease with chaperone function